jgi:hypothetical protein
MPKCADLREGIVYSRSQDKHQPYKIFITGSTLKQVNLTTRDSSIWEIQWVEECGFTIKYLPGKPIETGLGIAYMRGILCGYTSIELSVTVQPFSF